MPLRRQDVPDTESGWWTEIPEPSEFMDAFAAIRANGGKMPEAKDPCVLCGFECDGSKTPIFAAAGPRGRGAAHLWCHHILTGAERDRLRIALDLAMEEGQFTNDVWDKLIRARQGDESEGKDSSD